LFKIPRLRKGQYAFAKGDVTLGLEPISDEPQAAFSVAPNPATDVVSWAWEMGPEHEAKLEVYDATGRLVDAVQASDRSMDVSSWPSGTYQLTLVDSERVSRHSHTLVVRH
jgi:hypothetical protein